MSHYSMWIKHCKFGKLQYEYGLKGSDKDRFTRNFHSNFDLTSLTNLPNFNEKYYPEIAEI